MLSKRNIVFGLLNILVQTISGQQRCRTPNGPIGYCTPFQMCDSLFTLSQRPQLSFDDYNLIKKSLCDPLNGVQMICCPKSSQPDSNRNGQPVLRDQRITDLSKHPNAKLFDLKQCGKSNGDKISNGQATEPYEFPWMAMLQTVEGTDLYIHGYGTKLNRHRKQQQNMFFMDTVSMLYKSVVEGNRLVVMCGGSLISKRYVLSAAHCMTSPQGLIPIHSVVLGEHNTLTDPDCIDNDCAAPIQIISVEQQIPHPKFSTTAAKNDIGLLRLQRNPILSDSVRPVCLPLTIESQTATLTKLIITGWGTTENQAPSANLLKAILDVTPETVCSSIYKKQYSDRIVIDSTALCANDKKSASCSGDSGGPAVFLGATEGLGPRIFQYGIVSAGARTCGRTFGIPGLYTRVTSYMSWILDNIND